MSATRQTARSFTAVVMFALCLVGCRSGGSGAARGGGAPGPSRTPSGAGWFTDVTAESGLEARPWAWPDGTWYLPEIMGPGVAVFDFDGDGRLDILQLEAPPPGRRMGPSPVRLWRQSADGRFGEVRGSGLVNPGYAQGVAVGDVNNDGRPDVYLTNDDADALFRNNGDGTFSDVTAASGIRGVAWSSSAAFCDFDGDGWLDLYVAHYLRYDPQTVCTDAAGARDYCGPKGFEGTPDTLYHNNGDGTFTDVTERAGIRLPGGAGGKGLGVVCADFTHDGRADFFVANDGEPSQLWVNQGGGRFADEAFQRGVAVNRDGHAEAGMGIGLGDADGDGILDLYVTHLRNENNVLYAGSPGALFTDRTAESHVGLFDLPLTGFGTGFFDADLDGDLDLVAVNGRVTRGPPLPGAALTPFWNAFAEPNLLLLNDGRGVYGEAGAAGGALTGEPGVHRGLALGDLDGDGDDDLVISRVDGSLRLLRNDAPREGHHWLTVRALAGRRDALGAEVRVTSGGVTRLRVATTAGSYMSSSDPRARFGLGGSGVVDRIEIRWPDGRVEAFPGGPADRALALTEGAGATP